LGCRDRRRLCVRGRRGGSEAARHLARPLRPARRLARGGGSDTTRLFLGVGILGGFTTFSSFSLEYWTLFERGQTAQALAYVLASVLIGITACGAGMLTMRQLSA
jgi:fluoride ion exporter CrcB/FEX